VLNDIVIVIVIAYTVASAKHLPNDAPASNTSILVCYRQTCTHRTLNVHVDQERTMRPQWPTRYGFSRHSNVHLTGKRYPWSPMRSDTWFQFLF